MRTGRRVVIGQAYEKDDRTSSRTGPEEPVAPTSRLANMPRTTPSHRRRPGAAALTAALLVIVIVTAGCSRIDRPRSFAASLDRTSGETWTVQVVDNSGRVTNIDLDPAPAIRGPSDAPFNDPAASSRLVVPWTGGSCDTLTSFTVESGSGGQITISYDTAVAPGVCDLVGIGHQLVLETDPALPAAIVTLRRLP